MTTRTYSTARTPAQADYAAYLRSPRWRLLRRLRLWLDGGRCQLCHSRQRLQVHHASYENRGRGFWAELRDTIVLCSECHGKHHGKR